MPDNLQFLDDPDDVPYINQDLTLHVSVNGSDTENDGSNDSPFRSLGKAVDVVRNKQIKKNALVTIQLGNIETNRLGTNKKYFEEEEIVLDFETAKRIKIKGTKTTDHEVVGISYYEAAQDKDGYYCQIIVTNQDKICIGDYLTIYDHFKIKKKDPHHFWVDNSLPFGGSSRSVAVANCYVEAIRCDMILGVHEVVDVSDTVDHDGVHSTLSTELFRPEGLKVGAVTLHIKNHNHTYNKLKETPFYSTLGSMGNKPLYSYAAGGGNSPIQAQQNNIIPPVFYGADMLSNPQTAESNGYEQFYFSSQIQQIEIVDIMVRGYKLSLKPLDGKAFDPRTKTLARDATLLWNDKSLTGINRGIVASYIASYFYKKLIDDLGIDLDLPFYFGKSTNPFVTIDQIVRASKKIRDYLLTGANLLDGVPTWDEENHPGYGFGPFESGAIRKPNEGEGGAPIDTSSYPQEYADNKKVSILLRSYNLYPPINGQLYRPILVKRIQSWYNNNASVNGLQLDRWELKGNKSPFFCGYITPQGWYKKVYSTDPDGFTFSQPIPSLWYIDDPNGYHRLSGTSYPAYIGNTYTTFNKINHKAVGTRSNDRTSSKNLPLVDQAVVAQELAGLTGTSERESKGSMGTIWYAGVVNGDISFGGGGGGTPSVVGGQVFDRYSLGYRTKEIPYTNDAVSGNNDSITTDEFSSSRRRINNTQSVNIRAKCYKSILRFAKNGIKIKSKTKLGLMKDICLVKTGAKNNRSYGISVDEESVLNSTGIAVHGFDCGISARNQSLINLLSDLGDSENPYNKGILNVVDPPAIVSACEIGIESVLKSHINAQRTISSGCKKANYLAAVNSSMDCSNSISVGSEKHGFVCEFNSYMKAINSSSEFNRGIGYCAANSSILVCHRSRSIWNGSHGFMATTKGNMRCFESISRSNNGDGFLAKNKSVISAGANSSNWTNYRREMVKMVEIDLFPGDFSSTVTVLSSLPPHLYQVHIVSPFNDQSLIRLPIIGRSINANPTNGVSVFYHECNSTISEFNAGSGFASETDSLVIADNTISRYNSKVNGEFFVYGWSGLRGSFPTDTLTPFEGSPIGGLP
jgi:hypothetical protein